MPFLKIANIIGECKEIFNKNKKQKMTIYIQIKTELPTVKNDLTKKNKTLLK